MRSFHHCFTPRCFRMGEKASPPCLASTNLPADLTFIFSFNPNLVFWLAEPLMLPSDGNSQVCLTFHVGRVVACSPSRCDAGWNSALWVACFCGLFCHLNGFSCLIIRPDVTFFFRREVTASTGSDAWRHRHQYARLHNLPYFDVRAVKIRVLLARSWSVPLR